MEEMRSTDTTHILNQIEELQLEFGKIAKIVSDNGSNLVSQEFHDYSRRKRIWHDTSSPYTHSSNSHSEIGVKKC